MNTPNAAASYLSSRAQSSSRSSSTSQSYERGAASRPAPRAPPSASLLRGARLARLGHPRLRRARPLHLSLKHRPPHRLQHCLGRLRIRSLVHLLLLGQGLNRPRGILNICVTPPPANHMAKRSRCCRAIAVLRRPGSAIPMATWTVQHSCFGL